MDADPNTRKFKMAGRSIPYAGKELLAASLSGGLF